MSGPIHFSLTIERINNGWLLSEGAYGRGERAAFHSVEEAEQYALAELSKAFQEAKHAARLKAALAEKEG